MAWVNEDEAAGPGVLHRAGDGADVPLVLRPHEDDGDLPHDREPSAGLLYNTALNRIPSIETRPTRGFVAPLSTALKGPRDSGPRRVRRRRCRAARECPVRFESPR